jgi:hypothetical protein
MLFVPVATQILLVQSSDLVEGPYTTDTSAVIDANAQTVTVPIGAGNKFYRIQAHATLTNARTSGNNLLFNYALIP